MFNIQSIDSVLVDRKLDFVHGDLPGEGGRRLVQTQQEKVVNKCSQISC